MTSEVLETLVMAAAHFRERYLDSRLSPQDFVRLVSATEVCLEARGDLPLDFEEQTLQRLDAEADNDATEVQEAQEPRDEPSGTAEFTLEERVDLDLANGGRGVAFDVMQSMIGCEVAIAVEAPWREAMEYMPYVCELVAPAEDVFSPPQYLGPGRMIGYAVLRADAPPNTFWGGWLRRIWIASPDPWACDTPDFGVDPITIEASKLSVCTSHCFDRSATPEMRQMYRDCWAAHPPESSWPRK